MKYIKTENEFYELIKGNRVIVDFYADWCNPCKMMDMVLEDIEEEIIKVDVDRFGGIAKKYKILSIPSIKIFSNGEIIKENTGFMSRDEINKFLSE